MCFFVFFFSLPAALLLLLYKESFCSLHQQQQTTTIHPPSSFITKIPILMMVCLPSAMSCLVIEIQVNSPFTSFSSSIWEYSPSPDRSFYSQRRWRRIEYVFWVAGHSKSVTQIDCLFWESKDESQLLCFLFNTCRNPFGPMPNIIKSYRVHGQISRNSTGDDDDDVAQTVLIIST